MGFASFAPLKSFHTTNMEMAGLYCPKSVNQIAPKTLFQITQLMNVLIVLVP